MLSVVLHDCLTSSILTGIYAVNRLSAIVKAPAEFIINLSPSYLRGTHWICILLHVIDVGFISIVLVKTHLNPLYSFCSAIAVYIM